MSTPTRLPRRLLSGKGEIGVCLSVKSTINPLCGILGGQTNHGDSRLLKKALEATIFLIEAQSDPHDTRLQQKHSDAKFRAESSAREVHEAARQPARSDFLPSENLKLIYRELAAQMHPDMAVDQTDKERRHRFMSEANAAYADADEEKLRSILHRWEEERPCTFNDIGSELIALIRKIARLQEAIQKTEQTLQILKDSNLYKLRERSNRLQQLGRNLLEEMRTVALNAVRERQQYLSSLQTKGK